MSGFATGSLVGECFHFFIAGTYLVGQGLASADFCQQKFW